ncbi:hypothetical protein SCG7109_AU_00020 [Chlamydiales bacterium SCGC AG-110-M15]|nr:hypothetical protein SCG7109_AU_00020 [Chlamydiales bacterium SCGC AG-110-M15]
MSFGSALFFRSMERPKPFLVPVTDYEVLEVRETRMVLKHVSVDRSIKIGGSRDTSTKASKSRPADKKDKSKASPAKEAAVESPSASPEEPVPEKKRERRRRRRRKDDSSETATEAVEESKGETTPPKKGSKTSKKQPASKSSEPSDEAGKKINAQDLAQSEPSQKTSWPRPEMLLAPPPTLISDSISRYKDMQAPAEGAPPASEISPAPEALVAVNTPVEAEEKPKKRTRRRKVDKEKEDVSKAAKVDTPQEVKVDAPQEAKVDAPQEAKVDAPSAQPEEAQLTPESASDLEGEPAKKRSFASWLFPYGSEDAPEGAPPPALNDAGNDAGDKPEDS